jgi:hypothetical protein
VFAELIAGLTIGAFAARERAEAAIFLAFRPWLLLMLAIAAMRWPARERWALYGTAIAIASFAEALIVHLLGAQAAGVEAARAIAGSLMLALLFDGLVLFCARIDGWRGRLLVAAAGLVLIVIPGPIGLYEKIALRPEPALPATRPPLLLLSGLPLIWGEEDALGGKPTAFYTALDRAYRVRPIDEATSASLGTASLLLVAQPRPPGPAALVAIDGWVRGGGRAMILTDPALRWPSDLALGDPRRAPIDDGLGPLLLHWGLKLEPPGDGKVLVVRDVGGRRLIMAAPGRFVVQGSKCTVTHGGFMADCPIGRGRALLLADADLLHDLLWIGPGALGPTRAGRLADNAAFIIDQVDRLSGQPGRSQADRIDWMTKRP